MRPDTAAKQLPFEQGETRGWALVDGLENVALADTAAIGRRIGRNLLGPESAVSFHPPDTVGGNLKIHLLPKIQNSKDGCGHSCES